MVSLIGESALAVESYKKSTVTRPYVYAHDGRAFS